MPDFIPTLEAALIEKRKIAASTAAQYMRSLYVLNGKRPYKNLAWTKDYEGLQKIIDTYAFNTQNNLYTVLSATLALYNDKSTYKAAYKYWRDKMMTGRRQQKSQDPHIKSEKQEEAWLSWADVQKKKEEMDKTVEGLASKSSLTASEYEKALQHIVLCLYTEVAPRRNMDYLQMYVVRKMPKEPETTKNYYDMETHKFYFNVYKTAKKYGCQIVDVPEPLQKCLATFIAKHPLNKNKAKEFKLLVKHDGEPYTQLNSITRILNTVFGKKLGSSMLRHIYISNKFGNTINEMEKTAEDMGHSPTEQREYSKN